MNPWLLAALGLAPALAGAVLVAARGSLAQRISALPFAGAITVLMLLLLAVAFDQSSFQDLALTLALVGYPGTLIYAHFVERWL